MSLARVAGGRTSAYARPLVALVAAVAMLSSSSAYGSVEDLREVASRVERAWRAAGGEVTRREPRFVMEEETATLRLWPAPRRDEVRGGGGRDSDCRRVALIGARGMSFHVTAAAPGEEPFQAASVAGVVELHGCGTVPDTVKLKSDSGRGALETVVATAATALPPVRSVLLERTGGVLPSPPEPGSLPPLPPPAARASAADEYLARDGFVPLSEATWDAGGDGKGGRDLTLTVGCHQLALFAVDARSRDPVGHSHLDLDGAMRRADGDVIVEDQSIAPDVRLATCVGEPTKVRVTFEGAPRGSPVLVTHAFHPLPPHLPSLWPAQVRARVASLMLAHHVKPPAADAVVLVRGASGSTPMAIDLEPGACYIAVAAVERGRARGRGHGVALRASVDGRVSQDEQGAREDAALVAFCAEDATRGRLDVEGRSTASGWGVAVFRMVGGAWGFVR